MSPTLDTVPADQTCRPLTKAQFREFERGQQLWDRRRRVWTVHVAAHERGDGLTHVALRAGDYVRHVDELFADD